MLSGHYAEGAATCLQLGRAPEDLATLCHPADGSERFCCGSLLVNTVPLSVLGAW